MNIVNFILFCAICMLAHELGHILAARCVGIRVKRIGLGWLGLYNERERGHGWREVLVCLAGPGANVVLALLVIHQPWLALFNLEFGVVNLLPIPHSDGRHAWEAMRGTVNVFEVRP